MELLQKTWQVFKILFDGFFAAASPYLPIVYTVACMLAAIALFRKLRR